MAHRASGAVPDNVLDALKHAKYLAWLQLQDIQIALAVILVEEQLQEVGQQGAIITVMETALASAQLHVPTLAHQDVTQAVLVDAHIVA